MKLFKKLIPIASIASVAAVTVPLATSCQSDVITGINVDLQEVIESLQKGVTYSRQFAALPASTKLTEDEALSTYLKAVNSNHKLIADDLLDYIYAYYRGVRTNLVGAGSNIPVKPVLTDATASLTFGAIGADVNDSRLSFGATLNGVLPLIVEQTPYTPTLRFEIAGDLTIKVKNLSMGMSYNPEPIFDRAGNQPIYLWNIYANYFDKSIVEDDKWSISIDGWIQTELLNTGAKIFVDVTINNKSETLILYLLNSIIKRIDVPVFYFKNIKASDAE